MREGFSITNASPTLTLSRPGVFRPPCSRLVPRPTPSLLFFLCSNQWILIEQCIPHHPRLTPSDLWVKAWAWNGPRFLLIWKELDLESFRIAKTQSSAGSGPMGSSRGRRGGSHLHPSWKVSHPIDMPFWCHSWFYQIPLERSPALTKPNPLLPPLSKERNTCQLELPEPQNPILLKSLSYYHSFCQPVLTDWHKGKRKLLLPFCPPSQSVPYYY